MKYTDDTRFTCQQIAPLPKKFKTSIQINYSIKLDAHDPVVEVC